MAWELTLFLIIISHDHPKILLLTTTESSHIDQPLPPMAKLPQFWSNVDKKILIKFSFLGYRHIIVTNHNTYVIVIEMPTFVRVITYFPHLGKN